MKCILQRARWLFWLVSAVSAVSACGAVPFYDGFDATPTYGPGTNFLAPINGWGSVSSNAQVTASVSDTAPHSVQLTGPVVLSNNVGGAVGQIWTECRARPVFGDRPDLTANGTASLAGFFTPNRFFAITTNGGWLTCSNTIWGGAVSALTTGTFVRITVFQDYATSNSAVLVNSSLVAQDVRFHGNSATYRAFLAQNGTLDTASYLDTVSFSNGPPADITTDGNSDGIDDVDELALYGYAMRQLVVAPNAAYTNLQLAVNVARARDVIVVSNGTYAGNVTIDHAVTITGGSFTNSGSLSVAAGVTVSLLASGVFSSGAVSGTVNVATSGVLTVTGSLAMGASAVIQATGGALVSGSPAVSISGTFTINGSAWNNNAAQSSIPFSDGFESYGVGYPLANYTFIGWGASAQTVLVTTQAVAVGARAVAVPGGTTVSNRVNGVGYPKLWTDLRVRPTLGGTPDGLPTNTSTCLLYVNADGYVVVFNPTQGWVTCSSNVMGAAVTNLVSAGQFARLTVFVDFGPRQSAVFLDGQLLRQNVPFGAAAATSYSRFALDCRIGGAGGAGYMDEVSVRATPPPGLYGDIDGDGDNDLTEIDLNGNIFWHNSTVLQFR